MSDLLFELQEYEHIEELLEAMKKKEEEYKEEIKRLEEENKKTKELFLELFRSKSNAWKLYLDISLMLLETVMPSKGQRPFAPAPNIRYIYIFGFWGMDENTTESSTRLTKI